MPEGSDLGEGIVQAHLPQHIERSRDRFRPWHRVRKQFIRNQQWNWLTGRMITREWRRELQEPELAWPLNDSDDVGEGFDPAPESFPKRPIKCLVIPGDDLLDIRCLHEDIEGQNCSIRYLGFNESAGSKHPNTQIHVANNALTSLPRVWNDSTVLHDRFEALAKPQSQATRYMKHFGPFHVVNIDLCGSIFPNTQKSPSESYQALREIFSYQCAKQNVEWLFFMTTMVEPAVVDTEGFDKLCGPVRTNYDEHTEFAGLIECLIPTEAFPAAPPPSIDVSAIDERQMVQLFGVAFGKWLLGLCQSAKPKWTVAMRRSYQYSINETKGAVMLSLAFELKPNTAPPTDVTGITTAQVPPKQFPTELQCATKLVESVSNIANVEAILEKDPDLAMRLRADQARLLAASGYDESAYLKWVAEGEKDPIA